MHNKKIRELISQNSSLFWFVPEKEKVNISLEFLVETILNYGDEQSVKQLLDIVGTNKVADIFHKHISGNRINYFPQVVNFFSLYFQRHAQGNTNK